MYDGDLGRLHHLGSIGLRLKTSDVGRHSAGEQFDIMRQVTDVAAELVGGRVRRLRGQVVQDPGWSRGALSPGDGR